MSIISEETDHAVIFRKSPELARALRALNIFVGLDENFSLTPHDHVIFPKGTTVEPFTYFEGTNFIGCLGFASYTHSAPHDIAIGRYCSIAGGLRIMGMRHPIERITSSGITYDRAKPHYHAIYRQFELPQATMSDPPTALFAPSPVVENDVWIGMDVTLARGIRVHSGSVLAAGAVVTKDVPPYAIVGGNPAKIIKYRFDEPTRHRLLASAWWNLDPRILNLDLRLDADTFLSRIEHLKPEKYAFPKYDFSHVLAQT